MSGHSHWANIKHKKSKTDARRGKVWGKCAKAIMVAARHGGSDPATNLALRYAIEEAKFANMPRDTIERAAKKGAGELGAVDFVTVRYEGYAAGGVAIIADALTDNRTRTVGDVRLAFTKYGGNVGATGCVAYMFDARGRITIDESDATEVALMEAAIDAGAEDVLLEDELWIVTCATDRLIAVKDAIEQARITIESAELTMIPNTLTNAHGPDIARVIKLIDALEDNDDVQKVYTNLDASVEELSAAMQG